MKDLNKIPLFYRNLSEHEQDEPCPFNIQFLPALEYCGWINDEVTRKKVQECYPHCCFNHRVGLPHATLRDELTGDVYESGPIDLYEYEKEMVDRYESNLFYAQNKVRGAGATEILAVRHMAYKYAVTNFLPGRKAIIIAGINRSLAITTLSRIIKLLEPISFVFQVTPSKTSPTKLVFRTGGIILALPANPDAARGLENVGDVLLDESAFWELVDDEPVLKAVEPFVAKSGAHLGVISTPNGQRGFFWTKMFDPNLPNTKYHLHVVTLNQVKQVSQPTIDVAEAERMEELDPDMFAQEFGNQFILPSASVFGDQFARGNFECEF